MRRQKLFFFLLLFPLWMGVVQIETAPSYDFGEEFGKIITQASIKLQQVAPKRSFKLKAYNDSLEKTAKAALGMASREKPEVIGALLDEALKDYDKNSFAILLKAILASARQDEQGATRLYEEFLLKSRTFSEFEQAFLKWGEFHFLRRVAYGILSSRGISFAGREQQIRVRTPYEQLAFYGLRPGGWDRFMNIAFLVIILGGAVALVFWALAGAQFWETIPGGILGLYVAVWVSYGTWIFDLAFGLPWGWSRFVVVPVFLGSMLFIFLASVTREIWEERLRPLEQGYKRCPYCRAVIEELLIECSVCRRKI
ncbi:MAG: hypothetical protein HYZ83_04440 [Candidatus Omnitrophica bacterium]|nr:hypothetical protein [Candidatus Omnitrophota bacterium]